MKTIISALILALVLMASVASCRDSAASTGMDNDATVTQNVKISGPVAVESSSIETDQVQKAVDKKYKRLLLNFFIP